jgi:hypothetical protein
MPTVIFQYNNLSFNWEPDFRKFVLWQDGNLFDQSSSASVLIDVLFDLLPGEVIEDLLKESNND